MSKNQATIESLKITQFNVVTESLTEKKDVVFMLSDGLISYYYFPKMTPIDQLLMENKIVDFQLYLTDER